jgi:hypothetical protein
MSRLTLNIPHNLPKEEALKRIKNLLTNLKKEQAQNISNVNEVWDDDKGNFSFRAKGFDLSGIIKVNPSSVEIDSKLPFAVSLFKGTISSMITAKAEQLLSADKP